MLIHNEVMRQSTAPSKASDGPTITRLGTESEDDVSFLLYSYVLCQERVRVLLYR